MSSVLMSFFFILSEIVSVVFFFFKQKTAYEVRISDWSSDVCSSDLLRTYGDLLTPANMSVIWRTVGMAALVTLAAAAIAFPIAYYMARFATMRMKAVFYLAVMLPLWSSYLVRVYAWKLLLAKEGIVRSEEHTSELQSLMRIS